MLQHQQKNKKNSFTPPRFYCPWVVDPAQPSCLQLPKAPAAAAAWHSPGATIETLVAEGAMPPPDLAPPWLINVVINHSNNCWPATHRANAMPTSIHQLQCIPTCSQPGCVTPVGVDVHRRLIGRAPLPPLVPKPKPHKLWLLMSHDAV